MAVFSHGEHRRLLLVHQNSGAVIWDVRYSAALPLGTFSELQLFQLLFDPEKYVPFTKQLLVHGRDRISLRQQCLHEWPLGSSCPCCQVMADISSLTGGSVQMDLRSQPQIFQRSGLLMLTGRIVISARYCPEFSICHSTLCYFVGGITLLLQDSLSMVQEFPEPFQDLRRSESQGHARPCRLDFEEHQLLEQIWVHAHVF